MKHIIIIMAILLSFTVNAQPVLQTDIDGPTYGAIDGDNAILWYFFNNKVYFRDADLAFLHIVDITIPEGYTPLTVDGISSTAYEVGKLYFAVVFQKDAIFKTHIYDENGVKYVDIDGVFTGIFKSTLLIYNNQTRYTYIYKLSGNPESIIDGEKQPIAIFPNPTIQKLNIRNTKTETLHIYNLTGTLICTQKCKSGTSTINVDNLPSGGYFVKIGDQTVKFIKK